MTPTDIAATCTPLPGAAAHLVALNLHGHLLDEAIRAARDVRRERAAEAAEAAEAVAA